ncbi:Zinc finger FYVE domain-containing protein 9 [Dirofilaria immitis]|nr:Zinc finger FYVE domain-containing protein 9 [Dirofilaria immitis]
MDVVCDMDDLLNELEAAEMTGKLKYDANDSIINPKLVLLNTSNNFAGKSNATHFLQNDQKEEMKNVHAIDIEAINVLTDLIASVLLNESEGLHCNVEVKSDGITEQAYIPEYSRSDNSISANITDIAHDSKSDEARDGLSDYPCSYSSVILNECKETDSEELFSKATDEMEKISEQYSEMEQYLDCCGTNDNSVDFSGQQYSVSDTEVSSIFSSTNKREINTVEETDKKFLSRAIDSDESFQMASELEKKTNEEIRDAILEKIIENATPEFDATSCISTDEQLIDEVPHNISLGAEEISKSDDVQKNGICINGSTASAEHPSSSRCAQLSSITDDVKAIVNVVKKSEEIEAEIQGNNNEDEKQSELIDDDSDHSMSECETQTPVIDEAQAISVVSSTYDISRDTGVKYLTESERQLGKKKPIWIADEEALSCMICCIKFTVFVRRHHCRCCGRVLCARCTTQKASLSYVNNPKKEHRVDETKEGKILRVVFTLNLSEPATTNEYMHSSDISPATKPVLKSRVKSEEATSDDQSLSSNDAARNGSSVKRSVTFRDGLHPGYNSNETQPSTVSAKSKKHDSKRQHISRRLQQLRVTEEYICLLPGVDTVSSDVTEASAIDNHCGIGKSSCLYLRSNDGIVTRCDNAQECITSLKNFDSLEVMIFRNLWCKIKLCRYENKTVMCIISRGMSFVGLDEIFLAYYCDAELIELPIDYLWRICEIYQHALTFRNESSDEKLGIRLAHNRVPALNRTVHFSNSDKPVARDILLFRPSIQTFENFLVPSSSFLVGTFIYQSESIWANVIPQRLLFRLGLQASFYPTSIINDFNREPVYNSIFDTSVLKIFNDFRNWRFQMPIILGSTLMVRNNSESILIIPTWALEEIIKLIKANKNMIAWGLDFSPDADSYLVCKQDDNGTFSSQIFTNGVENRKGISNWCFFIVIDGALKDGGEPFAMNVLEDGMTIRFRSDIMESLLEALSIGQDFEQISSGMKFSIKWNDNSYPQQFIGGLGCYQYGLKKSRILGSSYPIPNQAHWSLRLVSVYNVAKGRFVQRVQSKVFSVSEQVAAQIATTLAPFVTILIEHDLRHIFFRIRVTTEDAEYKTQPWPGMEKEFAAWSDFLNYEVVPGLFTVCSYITVGFYAELHMALISIQPNP